MYRKKLFLESVHKLGLAPEKEDAVVSLFEATLDSNDNDELDMLDDENPSDNMDYLSGEVEDKPEGSAFEKQGTINDEDKQIAKNLINTLEADLNPYRNVSTIKPSLPNTPNGKDYMNDLRYILIKAELGDKFHWLNESIKSLMSDVSMFNTASKRAIGKARGFDVPSIQKSIYENTNSLKRNAITLINTHMAKINYFLNEIKKGLNIN